jgi:hypothetical protein
VRGIASEGHVGTFSVCACAINPRILLANPEISFYCTINKFLVFYNRINYTVQMAEGYVHSDVSRKACFWLI